MSAATGIPSKTSSQDRVSVATGLVEADFPESVDISEKHRLSRALFSSEKSDYETPDDLFEYWDSIFHFDFDACAEAHNAKVRRFISPEEDTLAVNWRTYGTSAWMNPPYGRGVGEFVKKAAMETLDGVTTVVLLPVRTGSRWWQIWVKDQADLIVYLPGRVKFKGATNSAPFDSAIAIYLKEVGS